jgi:Type VI secretion system/phage-baseplate injector OB domain
MTERLYRRFYGKYRGKVTDNHDPLMQGRIRAQVPSVFGGEESGWALPCTPYAGKGVGFFFIPPVDANVWIEFEDGNPDYPIWVGCFWGVDEAPKMPAIADIKIIKTDAATITLNDLPGIEGVTIETSTGLKIVIDGMGIKLSTISTGINITPRSVSINDGALEVMP